MLKRVPSERIGAGPIGTFSIHKLGSDNDFKKIQNHEFFKGIDFDNL